MLSQRLRTLTLSLQLIPCCGQRKLKEWNVAITPTTIDESTAWVRVRVDVPVAANSWISPFFFREHTVSSSVTLVTERPTAVQLSGVDQVTSGNGALGINALGIGL